MSYNDDEKLLISYDLIDIKTRVLLNPFTGDEVKIDRRRNDYKQLIRDLADEIRQSNQPSYDFKQYEEGKIILDEKNNFKGVSILKRNFKRFYGKTIRVIYTAINDNGVLFEERNIEFDIPDGKNFNAWWKRGQLLGFLIESPMVLIFEIYKKGYLEFVEVDDPIISNSRNQDFKEGITNCLLTPIKNWIIEKLENVKTKRTIQNYNKKLKTIDILLEQFKNGIPQEQLNMISEKLQIDINIICPLNNEVFLDAKCSKKPLRKFDFLNTRLDHVELNKIVLVNDIQNIEYDELLKIKKDLDKNNEFYTYTKNYKKLSSISTLEKKYMIDNEYINIVNDFEIKTGLINCKIDAIDDYDLSEFVLSGVHYNTSVKINDLNFVDLKLIDMRKAYTAYKACGFYKGFLGKITDFRKTDKIENVGLYKIDNIQIPSGIFYEYEKYLNIYKNGNVYPSPELDFLKSIGVKFDIVCGAWGIEKLDFDFNENMFLKDDDGISNYARYVGSCNQLKTEKSFYMKGKRDYFENMLCYLGDGHIDFFNDKEAVIKYKKKHIYHLSHFTAFITSYTRLNVLEQLLTMDIKNVYSIVSDGIYYIGDVKLKNVFRQKDDIREGGYTDSFISNNEPYNNNKYGNIREFFSKELHLGVGGSGKTHYNLIDSGLCKVLFSAPSWKLSRQKHKEYKVSNTVTARLLTDDPVMISKIKKYNNVLIIDECSMINETDKKFILDTYNDLKLIFCGDLGYQLPPINGVEMSKIGFDKIIYHNTDYRSKCTKLNIIKEKLRDMIKNNVNRGTVNRWFNDILNDRKTKDIKTLYNIDDMILCSTNIEKNIYTEIFEGKFQDINKYYILKNNRQYSNGEIIIGKKPENIECEVRHAFTVHSIQGETAKHNLFIKSLNMYRPRMLYTAISRARRLEQIYLI
jgi:hypothetical protein